MIPAINASRIYSTLGNNSSLVPLAVKDVANSLGLTTGSYIIGDKLEGKDRFLDEFGTQAIWLFGLPVFKKITDLTLYKALKIDPKADVRLLETPEILDKAIEFAPESQNNSIKKSLLELKNNPKFSKSLALTKFGIAPMRLPEDCILNNQVLWGSIGWATPAAFGAAIADKNRRVVLITGEGAHQLTAQEISTIMKHNLNMVIIVINNLEVNVYLENK